MILIEKARKLRTILESAAQKLSEKEASEAPTFYPQLKEDGSLIAYGKMINWHGSVKKAAVDMWDRAENNPDNAPNMWEDIKYKDGYRIIPDVITVGLAFGKDEYGWWKGELYRSKLATNVWTPDENPDGWEKGGT